MYFGGKLQTRATKTGSLSMRALVSVGLMSENDHILSDNPASRNVSILLANYYKSSATMPSLGHDSFP